MLVALVGCTHGCLESVYSTIEASGSDISLVICCGDFQSVRGVVDLDALAVPPKYCQPGDFHLYYSGKKQAPILTIFIGGNHEASNYLQELPYGGWVAPNIYYLGYAGVVTFGGLRIAGLSGIYKGHDYLKGHFEVMPFDDSTKRSVYHIRNLEVFRLRQLSGKLTICLSHDWPKGIAYHGDMEKLFRHKPFLREEIENGHLGSPPCEDLLNHLCPFYWFAAHMHCLFPAIVVHRSTQTKTRFLALDKCLPRRRFLQILHIPGNGVTPLELRYDLEWLTILRLTNHLLSVRSTTCHMPGENCDERYNFTPTEEEKNETLKMMGGLLKVPLNFTMTLPPTDFDGRGSNIPRDVAPHSRLPVLNPQTALLCDLLHLDDPVSLIMLQKGMKLTEIDPKINDTSDNREEENIEGNGDFFCDRVGALDTLECNDSTFVNSPTSLSGASLTPGALVSRISLPDPVHETKSDAARRDEESRVSSTCREDVARNPQSKSVLNDNSQSKSVNDNISDSTPNTTKKHFKRRNENLYASNIED